MGSQEPLWAAVSQPARVISTSCVLVPRTVCFSRTGRCTATNTGILSVQRYGHSSPLKLLYFWFYYGFIIVITLHFCYRGKHYSLLHYFHSLFPLPTHPHTWSFSLHFIDLSVHFQMVAGKGFEVHRRVYVDFEGINLRRKFLTGLEPESINMTIGKNIWSFSIVGLSQFCTRMK